ncbi:Transcription antitermination protein RfaH [Pseudorhizobium endolithicum]|uniref:Transcription antitermination protein RfaH n=2 Tax=Pseudorhizobium endolithicum TaxID=1191678 RepID=A0ABM8PCP1_9HYPH|nr:Transcription antitermination protein RfaH [Pseudorhizobium endolithicum]
MAKTDWYAIRIKPGYQRMASRWDAANEQHRLETIIERNLRNEGVECFMPSFRMETKHHRTKQWMEKRFPMLVGYAFVNLPHLNFEEVRAIDGVMCLLKPVRDRPPVRFSLEDIGALMDAEHEAYQNFLLDRERRIAREAAKLNKTTRRQMEKMFPPNTTAVIVDGAPFAGMLARVLGPSSRGKVKAVIETLNGFANIDVPLDNLRRAS